MALCFALNVQMAAQYAGCGVLEPWVRWPGQQLQQVSVGVAGADRPRPVVAAESRGGFLSVVALTPPAWVSIWVRITIKEMRRRYKCWVLTHGGRFRGRPILRPPPPRRAPWLGPGVVLIRQLQSGHEKCLTVEHECGGGIGLGL